MNDRLRDLLDPADDGRAFVDAVLVRSTGALHRRRRAAEAAAVPAMGWLERWARPWVLAALVLLAVAVLLPARPWNPAPRVAVTAAADSDAMVASMLPVDLAVAVSTEGR